MAMQTIPQELRDAAGAWIDDDPDPATRQELRELLRAGDVAELSARFAGPLRFGTAGVRGPLGAGPARMNRATMRRVVAGLARYLREQVPGAAGRVVVIGFDARQSSDLFAAEAAAVLSGAGLRAFRLPGAVPTPVLAFAVRHLGAVAGVMVTASHNPRGDNGCKVYAADGAQIIPPADEQIAAAAEQAGPLRTVPLSPRGGVLGPGVMDAYLDAVVRASLRTRHRDIRIAYTPLHGVGLRSFRGAFHRAGFPDPAVVAAQAEPDGSFPTLAKPNPQEPGALDLVLAEGTRTGAELVIANDPDADRLAAAIPDRNGGWRVLTGDEIGALLAWHLLSHTPPSPRRLAVTTVVSASLLGRMAAAAGIGYSETLTGFKWIMRAADRQPGSVFLFGYEEALGYAVSDVVRDKDGVSAALTLAETAAGAKEAGRSLAGLLDDLARRFGLHATAEWSVTAASAAAAADGAPVLDVLRAAPPAALLGRPVTVVDDLSSGVRAYRDGTTEHLGLPRSAVLVWRCADGTRVAVRPSGTEPKLKIYGQVVLPAQGRGDLGPLRSQAADQLAALHEEVTEMMEMAQVSHTDGEPR
jgi:phosphomannomutase